MGSVRKTVRSHGVSRPSSPSNQSRNGVNPLVVVRQMGVTRDRVMSATKTTMSCRFTLLEKFY